MEIPQFRTFLAIVEHKSFTRASEALHLSQPAVTRQIGALEQELGAQLLERRIRRVAVTPAGEIVQSYAIRILSLATDCRASVSAVRQGIAGRIKVAASSTAATYLLPAILGKFRELHPRIDLTVYTRGSTEAAQMVFDERADLGVVMDVRDHPEVIAIPGGRYSLVAVVAPGHRLAQRTSVRMDDLIEEPLIVMQRGANLRALVESLFQAQGATPRTTIEVDHVEAMKKMVEANLGITIVPDVAVSGDSSLRVLPIRGSTRTRRRWWAIHRGDRHLTAAMSAFLKVLLKK